MRTVVVKVNNSRVMDGIENASIRVTSPTGKSITLYKKHLGNVPKEWTAAFWKCCNDPMVRFVGEVTITLEEMQYIHKFSKIGYAPSNHYLYEKYT